VSSSTYRAELEGHDPQRHAPRPGTMERVLQLLDQSFGGSVGWLSAHGLHDADLERLRRRLAPGVRRTADGVAADEVAADGEEPTELRSGFAYQPPTA
jgi:hypothetical protein